MALKNCYLSSLILLLSLFHFQPTNAQYKGGYFSPGNGLAASDIDSNLFTHLFCTFAPLNGNQVSLPSGCFNFPKVVKLKNPNVQALLSIGGGNNTVKEAFIAMAKDPNSRKTFIDSSINVAVQNGFNGLDLDWEQQQTQDEMDHLAALLREWRAAIKVQSATEPLLLTAALNFKATADDPNVKFPAKDIADNLDWVNVMAYDLYAPRYVPKPFVTRPAASLHGNERSGSSGIRSWINAGVPANKLMLGLPFYGYAWILADANNNGLLAPATGGDPTYGDESAATYKDIKKFISEKRPTCKFDSTYVTDYCYSGTTWIGFDGVETIRQKVLYAKNEASLLGYFAWNIAQDSDWILSKRASETWG